MHRKSSFFFLVMCDYLVCLSLIYTWLQKREFHNTLTFPHCSSVKLTGNESDEAAQEPAQEWYICVAKSYFANSTEFIGVHSDLTWKSA